MKKLSKEEISRKSQLIEDLATTAHEIQESITSFNVVLQALFEPIEELTGRYNELVCNAREFLESVHEQQEAYMEDKSEAWREGDAGQAYEEWADAWSLNPEEVEVCPPETMEEPTLEVADLLEELPDQP